MSGRYSFRIRYFDTNIWEFFIFFFFYYFKENLNELQPCLRNAGNGVSECSILKISWRGAMPQTPSVLVPLALERRLAALDKFTSGAFTTMSATLQSY